MASFPGALVALVVLALHAFGVFRAVTVCRDVRKGALVARGAIGALLAFVGVVLLTIAIATVWLLVAVCIWLVLVRPKGVDGSIGLFLALAFAAFPPVHAIAEFLIHVGLEDAATREALHGEFVPRGDRRDE